MAEPGGPRGGKTTVTRGGFVRTTISLDPATLRLLKEAQEAAQASECAQVSRSELIRRALTRYAENLKHNAA